MAEIAAAHAVGRDRKEGPVKGDKYHLVELSMGWLVLLAGRNGLKRAPLKPSPQEALEGLGTCL